jgi:DNA polymerase-1
MHVLDIETEGLDGNYIHCIVLRDCFTDNVETYGPSQIEDGLRSIMSKDRLVGHNLINFDLPFIARLYPWFNYPEDKVVDTLVCSRLIWTDLSETDPSRKVEIPSKLKGSHSLAAWGHRLKCHKGDYQGGWDNFSDDMLEYCVQDTAVTALLWKTIQSQNYSKQAIELEHQVQWLIARQERHGFMFDETKALVLCQKLSRRRVEIEEELQTVFTPWWSFCEEVTPKRTINYKNTYTASKTKGCVYSKVKLNVFNPGSRHHVADRLKNLGWRPQQTTPDGHPKVDETTLKTVSFPQAILMREYFIIQKRLGMLSEGKHSWLGHLKASRIHGSVICNGTVTGRASMRSPNLQQVPAVTAPFGGECRELFRVPPGKLLVGVDMSGLELRMLGHFTAPLDNGAYSKVVIDGDIHTHNQNAAGLDSRDIAKRFIYAFIFGAGINKLAEVTSLSKREVTRVKDRFLTENHGLRKLIDLVKDTAENRGYLLGLDKRKLSVRSPHRALNVLLQSSGALCSKQWLIEFDKHIEERGLRDRVQQVAWVHDEIQIETDEELAEQIGHLATVSIEEAGKRFNLRVPLKGEYRVGKTWASTH